VNSGDDRTAATDRDISAARDSARRYHCEFADLLNFQLLPEVLKNVPIELMFRYNFVPLERTLDGKLAIAIADPGQLMMIDEISLLLNQRVVVRVSTLGQISGMLNTILDQAKKIDEDSAEMTGPASDDLQEPGDPDQPVCAPLDPKPSPRSGGAMAVPDDEQ
jgi:type IV pilus assembly protein PilB